MVYAELCVGALLFSARFLITKSLFDHVAGKKRKPAAVYLTGGGLYLLSWLQLTFFSLTWLDAGLFFLVNAAFLLICYTAGPSGAAAYSVLAVLMTAFSQLPAILFALYGREYADAGIHVQTAVDVICLLIYLVLTRLMIRLLSKYSVGGRRTAPLYFFIHPAVTALLLVLILELCAMVSLSPGYAVFTTAAAALSLASVILTYVFYEKSAAKDSLIRSLDKEVKESKIREEYTTVMACQNDRLSRLIHDEKNHLDAIAAMTDDQRVIDYISSIKDELIVSSAYGNTNNRLLDLIVGKYVILCKDKGLDFSVNIKTSNLDFIDDADLTSLICNVMDNAVEAAAESREKRIELNINKSNGFDLLKCVNTCGRVPDVSESGPGSLHGNGLKIIRRVSKKYGGDAVWKYDDAAGEFTLSVIFSGQG